MSAHIQKQKRLPVSSGRAKSKTQQKPKDSGSSSNRKSSLNGSLDSNGVIRTKRIEIAKRMKVQRKYSSNKSMALCGSSNGNVQIGFSKGSNTAHTRGTNTCKNPSCAYCSGRLGAKRFETMTKAVEMVDGLDGLKLFGTFTIPKQNTAKDARQITKVWSRWWARTKTKMKRKYPGVEPGYFRSVETTLNPSQRNKFHTHIHFIMVLTNSQGLGRTSLLIDDMITDWTESVTKEIGQVSRRKAQRVDVIEGLDGAAIRYMSNPAKTLFELDGSTKVNKVDGGGYSPFSLLDEIHLNEDQVQSVSLVSTYKQYISGMRGLRVLTAGGLWRKIDKELDEMPDDDEEVEPTFTEVFHYDRHIHRAILNHRKTYAEELAEDYLNRGLRKIEYIEFAQMIVSLNGLGDLFPESIRDYIEDHMKKYKVRRL